MADDALRAVFERFALFGAGTAATHGAVYMDGRAFSKLCRDCKLVDNKTLRTTDVDLVFANIRVKPKSERKINFDQFEAALGLVAERKFPGDPHGERLVREMVGKTAGPQANKATKASTDAITAKMTDASLYTGSHKSRFNDDGTGRGKAGRDAPSKGAGHVPASGVISGGKAAGGPPSQYNNFGADAGASAPLGKDPMTTRPAAAKASSSSSSSGSKPAGKKTMKKATSKPSIFDKLTDPSQYTGTHKERFNADGTGRGLAGRDSINKTGAAGAYRGGDVKDLSQITRSNLR